MLADKLQAPLERDGDLSIVTDVPTIEPGPGHPFAAARSQGAMQAEVHGKIFERDQPRPPAFQITGASMREERFLKVGFASGSENGAHDPILVLAARGGVRERSTRRVVL